MTYLIFSVLFACFAAGMVVAVIMRRHRSVPSAVSAAQRQLAINIGGQDYSEVDIASCYPLSEEMIKDVAVAEGYQFLAYVTRRSSRKLKFRWDPQLTEKADE